MTDDGIEMPDAVIGVALIEEMIQEELMDGAPAEVLSSIVPDLNMVERRRLIQLQKLLRIVGDKIDQDPEFQELRKEVEKCHGRRESFLEVARNVLQDRITLDRIAVLVYLAGRLQVRSLRNVLWWIVEKCANLLHWILKHGRWILELDNSLFVRVILRVTLKFFCTKFLNWVRERGRQDCIHVTRLTRRIKIVCERLRNDEEFQAGLEAIAQAPGSRLEDCSQVVQNAFGQGLTWERITVLLYVFGELAMRMNHWSVRDFLRWARNFFHPNHLSWAQERGRQISGSSEPATASVNNTTSLASSSYGPILTFAAGVALGSFITWRATRTL